MSSCNVYLTELSPKDKPWDLHRAVADVIQSMYDGTEYQRYADRMDACAQWLKFALTTSKTEDELLFKLVNASFCRVRFCPVCGWRVSLQWKSRVLRAAPKILEAYPSSRWVFLTLTVRNCPIEDLRKTIAFMNKGFQRLSQRKIYPALGHIKSLEVTRSKDGSAHPHFHVLMMVPSGYFGGTGYIKQEKWRALWRDCCRLDYDPTVDVRSVKPKPDQYGGDKLVAFQSALKETFKYCVKEKDLVADKSWLLSLTDQMHNVRSIAISGVLRDFIVETDPEDLVHEEDSIPEVLDSDPRYFFDWSKPDKHYKFRSSKREQDQVDEESDAFTSDVDQARQMRDVMWRREHYLAKKQSDQSSR